MERYSTVQYKLAGSCVWEFRHIVVSMELCLRQPLCEFAAWLIRALTDGRLLGVLGRFLPGARLARHNVDLLS